MTVFLCNVFECQKTKCTAAPFKFHENTLNVIILKFYFNTELVTSNKYCFFCLTGHHAQKVVFFPGRVKVVFSKRPLVYLLQEPTEEARLIKNNPSLQDKSAPMKDKLQTKTLWLWSVREEGMSQTREKFLVNTSCSLANTRKWHGVHHLHDKEPSAGRDYRSLYPHMFPQSCFKHRTWPEWHTGTLSIWWTWTCQIFCFQECLIHVWLPISIVSQRGWQECQSVLPFRCPTKIRVEVWAGVCWTWTSPCSAGLGKAQDQEHSAFKSIWTKQPTQCPVWRLSCCSWCDCTSSAKVR